MALTTNSLSSSLHSIGISQAKGVAVPMLREQNAATLKGSQGDTASPQSTADDSGSTRYTATTLTPEQQRQLEQLRQIERDVIAHEQAHMAVGRDLITGGPTYSYAVGPDGKRYINGGEVGIDTSPEREPQANIEKGLHIQATALAPKDPSTQDYQVAAIGGRLESRGRTDLYRQEAAQQAEAEAARQNAQADNQRQALAKTYGTDTATSEAVSVFA